jgi:hypothetical protein
MFPCGENDLKRMVVANSLAMIAPYREWEED